MSQQTVSVELPEDLYQRVCEIASAAARSVQEVLTVSIAMSLPPLEKDLPPELRVELGPMDLLNVDKLRKLSCERLDHDREERLEQLAELQKKQPLSDAERTELADLVEKAQRVMLHRAEASRLLALRGHLASC